MSKRIINLLSITIILIVGCSCLANQQMILAQLFEYAGRSQGGGDITSDLYAYYTFDDENATQATDSTTNSLHLFRGGGSEVISYSTNDGRS